MQMRRVLPLLALFALAVAGVFVLGTSVPRATDFIQMSQWIWYMALAVAGVGFLSMALLQMAKRLLSLRARIQRRVVGDWAHRAPLQTGFPDWVTSRLAPGWLNLPIEQITAQFAALAEVALSSPGRNRELLIGLTSHVNTADVDLYIKRMKSYREPPSDQENDEPSVDHESGKPSVDHELLDLRTVLNNAIQRRLDALQTNAAAAWQRFLLLASMSLSGALGFVGALAIHGPSVGTWKYVLFFVPVAALLGGYFAGVWRDLIATLEKRLR